MARSRVGELHIADEVLADGARDRVPAGPRVLQDFRIAALGDDLAELLEILAAVRAARAIFSLSVSAFHARSNPRELLAFLRVGGGGDGKRELEQLDLAFGDGVELEPVEAGGLLRVLDRGRDSLLVEFGGDQFSVVGDVRGLDPVGTAGIDAQGEELLFDVVDEVAGFFGGRFGIGGEGDRGAREEGAGCGSNLHW